MRAWRLHEFTQAGISLKTVFQRSMTDTALGYHTVTPTSTRWTHRGRVPQREPKRRRRMMISAQCDDIVDPLELDEMVERVLSGGIVIEDPLDAAELGERRSGRRPVSMTGFIVRGTDD